ncbi:imidazoleglycerol phosphate synthase glutamine amidotransferase subunit HisH [Bradyrhizobium sp. JR6.1]
MTVAIIDYGSGNLHSAAKAFERAARSMQDPQAIKVTRDPDAVYRADRIVLPGVGAFSPIAAAASMRSTACWKRSPRRCGSRRGRSSASASACS